eukprot:NODE_502_length_7546_cov_0.138982.p4 type:complete len:168 gc:universal NODE_502_length_7546_cov_0.138982:3480-3983(+)
MIWAAARAFSSASLPFSAFLENSAIKCSLILRSDLLRVTSALLSNEVASPFLEYFICSVHINQSDKLTFTLFCCSSIVIGSSTDISSACVCISFVKKCSSLGNLNCIVNSLVVYNFPLSTLLFITSVADICGQYSAFCQITVLTCSNGECILYAFAIDAISGLFRAF